MFSHYRLLANSSSTRDGTSAAVSFGERIDAGSWQSMPDMTAELAAKKQADTKKMLEAACALLVDEWRRLLLCALHRITWPVM